MDASMKFMLNLDFLGYNYDVYRKKSVSIHELNEKFSDILIAINRFKKDQ